MILRIKNWASFQHYRDRAPLWIKLHRSLLDNYDFQCLPIASKALAPMLWLLASEYKDGVIEASEQEIAFRLRMTVQDFIDALKPLIDRGFVIVEQVASKPLAVVEQTASLEKRREREEREIEQDGPSIVFAIATSHPKLAHLRNEAEIPHNVADAIISAFDADTPGEVLEGTRGWAAQLDDPKFAEDPYKFFTQFKYRPEAWKRNGSGKQSKLDRAITEAFS